MAEKQSMTCKLTGCTRPVYAGGLCQTHHRQKKEGRRYTSIRPYDKRLEGSVKYGTLRLSPECAALVAAFAKEHTLTPTAAIAKLLEEWGRSRS